jgi:tetratricopeptide (TPR) repeat protein
VTKNIITFTILLVFNLVFTDTYTVINLFAAEAPPQRKQNISPRKQRSFLKREQNVPSPISSFEPKPTLIEFKAEPGSEQSRAVTPIPLPKAGGITKVDYLALRLNYAQSKKYNPYDSEIINIRRRCEVLIDEGKFKEALKEAKAGLIKNKYNVQLLIILAATYRKLGEIKQAEKYTQLWRGIFGSIVAGADGKSAEAAFRVIDVNEEYAVLEVFGLERIAQRLEEVNGSNFDILTVRDSQTGKTFDLYFNVDIPLEWLAKKIEADKKVIKLPKKVKVK